MKTCSYCGKENDDATAFCRECGTERFHTPGPASPPPVPENPKIFQPRQLSAEERQQTFVTLRSCRTIEEGDTLVTQLKAGGFDAFLPDESLMITVALNLNTYGYVRVNVPATQYDAAAEFLKTSEEAAIPLSDAEAELAQLNANLPLPNGMRFLMFLLPAGTCPTLIMGALILSYYINKGFKRRGDEVSAALVLGLLFWMIVYAVVVSSRSH